jgi:hypothetical protein
MKGVFLAAALGLAVASPSPGAVVSPEAARAALLKATEYLQSLAPEGGDLWSYSAARKARRGETQATATQIWVQPPGTPAVGEALLRAWAVTGDRRHWEAAQAAALALVRGQLDSGGWAYLVEFDPQARRQWAYRVESAAARPRSGVRNTTTFDDDNTQSALRFLVACLAAAPEHRSGPALEAIRAAADYGLSKMIEAQYPNGAWPQRYEGTPPDPARHPVQAARFPKHWSRTWPKPSYGGFYTFNDHTQRDCILTLLAAWRHLKDRRFLESARRGGDFILRAQLPEPQPAWAQQYNFAMEPDWARAFEPPAVSAAESAGVLRTLADLYLATGDAALLKPIPAAVAWYRRSQIGPNRWARLYELESNTPIYGDRDGRIHSRLSEISAERRSGYAWEGGFGIPETLQYVEGVLRDAATKPASKAGETEPAASPAPSNRENAEGKGAAQSGGAGRPANPAAIGGILAAQEASGRWLTQGRIEMRTFIRNMNVLCDYLAGVNRG